MIEGHTDAEGFQRTCKALELIGVDGDTQTQMWELIALVLNLGQLTFTERKDAEEEALGGGVPSWPVMASAAGGEGGEGGEAAEEKGEAEAGGEGGEGGGLGPFEAVAAGLGVSSEALTSALCERIINARGDVYTKLLDQTAAAAGRDALAKALYTALFDWLVKRINGAIGAKEDDGMMHDAGVPLASPDRWVGILDIFGFG